MTAEPDTGVAAYTYGVARPFDPARIADLRGVDGAAVRLVRHEAVVAVVSALPSADVDDAALRARLEDLSQLEAVARAHHAVVDTVAASSVTVPFRLATIHRGEARVAEILRRGYPEFDAALERFEGQVELGVKVYARREDLVPAAASPLAAASSGRDYLRRRRAQADLQDRWWQRAVDTAQRVDTELGELVADRRHHRPQDPQLSGEDGENVLNAAYLVHGGRVAPFVERVAELDAEIPGVSVVVTGPWPPYSFAALEDDAATERDEGPTR
jgi:Gas vesicle synthesis protein GvpL/GvpF